MKGFIAAAGLSTRLQDLGEKRNKVLLDLGGETILGNLLSHFEQAGIDESFVTVGHDALAVRGHCGTRGRCILNPFYEQHGILSSVWLLRPFLAGEPFLFSVGDHYCALSRLLTFLADQPTADILVDVELKTCDDEDMKVFVNRAGNFRTMTKAFLDGPILGEFTGMVRFSAEGSQQFFDMLERHVWQHGIQGYVADVLCTTHRKWELAFHLSNDHRRIDIDFPRDLARARELYRQEKRPAVA
jgi:choline kinase